MHNAGSVRLAVSLLKRATLLIEGGIIVPHVPLLTQGDCGGNSVIVQEARFCGFLPFPP